jgi:hypothetical protein
MGCYGAECGNQRDPEPQTSAFSKPILTRNTDSDSRTVALLFSELEELFDQLNGDLRFWLPGIPASGDQARDVRDGDPA